MFYKSSILAAIFVLLSVGNAIAADLANTEISIDERQSELIVNTSDSKTTTTKNSASIAKTRLLKISTTDTQTATKSTVLMGKNNQAELNNIPSVSSQSTAQPKIADASSELNTIKQWEINKSVTLTNILLTSDPVRNIAQSSERLPNNSIPSAVMETTKPIVPATPTPEPSLAPYISNDQPITTLIERIIINQKPAVTPLVPTISTQKPAITPLVPTVSTQKPKVTPGTNESITSGASETSGKPTTPVIKTKKPAPPKPMPQIIEAQKPAPQDNEPKKWAVGVHTQFSTTGFFGIDAGYKFNPNLHARLGLNTVGFNVDYTSQGIDYKSKFNPTNVHLLGDFFPFGGGLRLTGGLVFQSNQFNATGTPSGIPTQISLGGVNYNINDVGIVSSEGSFNNSVAPYLGIGFGTPLSPGLGFNLDAGVMFAGSANVKLRANIPSSVPVALQNQIRSSLADQERRTNNDIGGFNLYPVLSVGVSYAF